jgi:hypothetical protein
MRCGDHPHLPPTNPLPLPPAGGCCPHFVPGRSSRDDPDQPLVGAGEPPGVRRPAARWLRVVVAVVQAGTGSQADGGQLLQGQAGHVAVAADPSAGELGGPAAGAGELAGAQPGLAAGRALRAAGAGGEAAVQPARAELVGVAGVVSLRTQGRPCGRPPAAAVLAPATTRQSPGTGPTLSVAGTKHSPPAHQREGGDQLAASTTPDQEISLL